jgi:hypothetical protein
VKEHIRTTIAPENDNDTTSKTFKSKFNTALDKLVTAGHVENPNENISCVKLTQGIKKRIRVGDLQPGQIFKETSCSRGIFRGTGLLLLSFNGLRVVDSAFREVVIQLCGVKIC